MFDTPSALIPISFSFRALYIITFPKNGFTCSAISQSCSESPYLLYITHQHINTQHTISHSKLAYVTVHVAVFNFIKYLILPFKTTTNLDKAIHPMRLRKKKHDVISSFYKTFLSWGSHINPTRSSSHIIIIILTKSLSKLLLKDILEGDGIGGKLADTLAQLLNSHLVLVEVESEESLVLDVRLAVDVGRGGLSGVELLGDSFGGVHEVLEKVGL